MVDRTAEDIQQDARLADHDQRIKYLTDRVRELFNLETRIIEVEHKLAPIAKIGQMADELRRRAEELLRAMPQYKLHDPMAKFD